MGEKASDPNRPNYFSLQIEPTDLCNSKCIMCPQGRGTPAHANQAPGKLDLQLFKRILAEFAEFKFEHKTLTMQWMGEPLANSDFLKFIECIAEVQHEKPFETLCFVTNGLMFSEHIIKALTRLKSIMVIVEFSLDAHLPSTYSKIKHPLVGGLEQLRENIKAYLRATKHNSNFWVGLRFIVMEENFDELGEFISYWSSFLKAEGIEFEVSNQHFVDAEKCVRISLWPLLYSQHPEKTQSLFEEAVKRYVK